MPVTIHPAGTTIYKPEECYSGYTAILLPGEAGPDVALIDMNGNAVHRWTMDGGNKKGGIPRARLLPSGRLLVLRTVHDREDGYAEEYDWNGDLVWEYAPPGELWPAVASGGTRGVGEGPGADALALSSCRTTRRSHLEFSTGSEMGDPGCEAGRRGGEVGEPHASSTRLHS